MLRHSTVYLDTLVNEWSSRPNCHEQMRAYSADKLDRLLLASSPVVENIDSTGTDVAVQVRQLTDWEAGQAVLCHIRSPVHCLWRNVEAQHTLRQSNTLWWSRTAEFPPQLNRRITIRKISADSPAGFFSADLRRQYNGGYGYRRRLRGLCGTYSIGYHWAEDRAVTKSVEYFLGGHVRSPKNNCLFGRFFASHPPP